MSTLPEAVTEQQKRNKEEYEYMDAEFKAGRPPEPKPREN